ncbi:DNA polymerase III subunit beta, partial [Striga asiatica]
IIILCSTRRFSPSTTPGDVINNPVSLLLLLRLPEYRSSTMISSDPSECLLPDDDSLALQSTGQLYCAVLLSCLPEDSLALYNCWWSTGQLYCALLLVVHREAVLRGTTAGRLSRAVQLLMTAVQCVLGTHSASAEWASRVGLEPRVDTLDVESVAAFGEEAEELVWVEPVEADGALQPVFLVAFEGREPEDWEGLDRETVRAAGVLAGGRRRRRGGGGVHIAVLHVEEEEERDGEDGREDPDCHRDPGLELLVAGAGRSGTRRRRSCRGVRVFRLLLCGDEAEEEEEEEDVVEVENAGHVMKRESAKMRPFCVYFLPLCG